ncbi:MAG: SLC13 family permease [Candidatus Izemoplasmatales bacterium]|nr:SLC13 family permease [Candidatus Izemoplasmatales bacterium]
MKKLSYLILKDKVFLVAVILAIVTMFIIPPSKEYLDYINYKVLVVMFTIMLAVAGIFESHFFYFVATKLVVHFKNMRFIALSIVLTTFVLSMFLTNDAVLLTLIPFSIFVFRHVNMEKHLIMMIILQTIAANLGSALTPMGDPQNIYLYAHYQLGFSEFIGMTLPITIMGGVLIILTTILVFPKQNVVHNIKEPKVDVKKLFWYLLILLNALLSILKVMPLLYTFIITVVLGLIFARHLFKRVDWYLLLTFLSFFIITGNLSQMTNIGNFLSGLLSSDTKVYFTSMATSQFISNVPAAVLLSTFTDPAYVKALLQGVNVGAMGTLIASLASLISFKYILRDFPKSAKTYILKYTLVSIIYMSIITAMLFLVF